MGRIIACADIGSNTAHLLIAHATESGLKRLVNESIWLSLGEVVTREGEIPKEKAKELLAAMRQFDALIKEYGAKDTYIFATEAMRKASNHEELLNIVKTKVGFNIDIISPRMEAELSYKASQIDTSGPEPMLLLEAGGGSVQVAHCRKGKICEEFSLPIGTGALTAHAGLSYPATQDMIAAVREKITEEASAISDLPRVKRVVACGGVARGLWRALHPDGDQTLTAEELKFLAWDCQRLIPSTIVARYDVKLKRAETLLLGALIYLEFLGLFAHDELTVSKYGVREGAILELAKGKEKGWLTS
ncbi:MAG: hypothetical protein R2688_01885 [Fimbriimonadaceae bacterium]